MKTHLIASLETLRRDPIFNMEKLLKGFEKGDVELTAQTPTRKRSVLQNAAMWKLPNKMLADAMTEQFGEDVTPDMAHEVCKDRFKDTLLKYQKGLGC
jgi:protein gp37